MIHINDLVEFDHWKYPSKTIRGIVISIYRNKANSLMADVKDARGKIYKCCIRSLRKQKSE